MYVEKRIGGDYYQYVISITTYNPEQAAIRTLKWYVNYLNQRLFQSCYSYELTHGECFLIIHLKESEYKDTASRSRCQVFRDISFTLDAIYRILIGNMP